MLTLVTAKSVCHTISTSTCWYHKHSIQTTSPWRLLTTINYLQLGRPI